MDVVDVGKSRPPVLAIGSKNSGCGLSTTIDNKMNHFDILQFYTSYNERERDIYYGFSKIQRSSSYMRFLVHF